MLRAAGFHANVGRLLEFPRHSTNGVVLLAKNGERPLGVGCAASFGATGWIGALGVVPDERGRGLGTALTEEATAWLRERGAQTVLLYATELGRPVYERLGFEAEGIATAWRGRPGRIKTVAARRLREADREAVAALDSAATGEERSAVLGELRPLSGMAVESDGRLRGWAVASPWGAGVAITADDPTAGTTLMAEALGTEAGTLVVPQANHAAVEALESWRFLRLNDAERMRLGPAPAWSPERQFGLFNLFWG